MRREAHGKRRDWARHGAARVPQRTKGGGVVASAEAVELRQGEVDVVPVGVQRVVRGVGVRRVVEAVGVQQLVEAVGVQRVLE